MSWGFVTAVRNARLQVLADAVDAGAGAGKLRIFDGTRPATGEAVTDQTLLIQFTLTKPCASSIADGVLTWDLDPDITAYCEVFSGSKEATWARLVDSDGNAVGDGDVGLTGSGSAIELSAVTLAGGQEVTLTTGSLTEGNP
jgi:hypothetical protein